MTDRIRVPPLQERIARACAYTAVGFAGIWGVIGPLPKSLEMALHPFTTVVWVAFMCVGFACAWASLSQRWLVEYGLLLFPVFGLLAYGAAMVAVTVTGENPGSGIAMFLVSGFAGGFLSRWFSLAQLLGFRPRDLLRRVLKKLPGRG